MDLDQQALKAKALLEDKTCLSCKWSKSYSSSDGEFINCMHHKMLVNGYMPRKVLIYIGESCEYMTPKSQDNDI